MTEEVLAFITIRAMEAAMAVAANPREETEDFVSKVLGDTPMNRAAGIPPDAIQGQCAGVGADMFCRRKRLQVTFRAGFTQHRSVDVCGILVRALVPQDAVSVRPRGLLGRPGIQVQSGRHCRL